jgi:hypothetical protein
VNAHFRNDHDDFACQAALEAEDAEIVPLEFLIFHFFCSFLSLQFLSFTS